MSSSEFHLRSIVRAMQELRDDFDIDVRVLGMASSKKMLLSDGAIDLSTWREQYETYAPPLANGHLCLLSDIVSIIPVRHTVQEAVCDCNAR